MLVAVVGNAEPQSVQKWPVVAPRQTTDAQRFELERGAFTNPRRVSSPPTTASTSHNAFSVCNSAYDDIHELLSSGDMPIPEEQPFVTTQGWTLESLLEMGMKPVERVSALQNAPEVQEAIRKYEEEGVPVIVDNWHNTPMWPKDGLFGVDWLLKHGEQNIVARNRVTSKDEEMLLSDFIAASRSASHFAAREDSARYYGKDAVCPKEWKEWLLDGPLPKDLLPGGPEDVLEILDESERVETLMCYLGIGDTFTAAHKDLCASSGHNLMCYTEDGGSSFWFMTHSSDAPRVATWFQKLGYELDHETYVVSPEEFAKAPFPVFVAEQKLGDLVLVPKRSCHQVVNNGGLTMKMSWSRMTVDGLVTAFHHELPVYRRVCRQETYRVKLLTYRTLLKYSDDLQKLQQANSRNSSPLSPISPQSKSPSSTPFIGYGDDKEKHRALYNSLCKLLELFNKILVEEYQGETTCERRPSSSRIALQHSPTGKSSPHSQIPVDHNTTISSGAGDALTCDFCGADIFQSFFECRKCVSTKRTANEGMNVMAATTALAPDSAPETDSVIICPCCYVEGRSCLCKIMRPVQRFVMEKLVEDQNRVVDLINRDVLQRKKITKFVHLSSRTMHTFEHPQIFSSACKLVSIRNALIGTKRPERICSRIARDPHAVPAIEVLNCKQCHVAWCFEHILRIRGFHSSEAIQYQISDKENKIWHERHKDRREKFPKMVKEAEEAEKLGIATDMRASLVLHSVKFYACFPINQTTVSKGWYDLLKLVVPKEESIDLSLNLDGEEVEESPSDVPKHFRSPVAVDYDQSSMHTTLSAASSRATSTGNRPDAFVELPTLNSTKRKRYERMERKNTEMEEIAKQAANKRPKAVSEVFNGVYGVQPDVMNINATSASTSKRIRRVSSKVAERDRQMSTSPEPWSSSEPSNARMRKHDAKDSNFVLNLREAPPPREPSKRPTTFHPANLSKRDGISSRNGFERIDSITADGGDMPVQADDDEGQEKVVSDLPRQTAKRVRIGRPDSPLPVSKRRKDAAAVTEDAESSNGTHPLMAIIDTIKTELRSVKAQLVKSEQVHRKDTRRQEQEIRRLEDQNGQLFVMIQELTKEMKEMKETTGRHAAFIKGASYGAKLFNGLPALASSSPATWEKSRSNEAGSTLSQYGDFEYDENEPIRREASSDNPQQGVVEHAYAGPSVMQSEYSTGTSPLDTPTRARPAASGLRASASANANVQPLASVSRRNIKTPRTILGLGPKPTTVTAAVTLNHSVSAGPVRSPSALPSSTWDPSSQPQSQAQIQLQPQPLEESNSTSQFGDPSSPTLAVRKAIAKPLQQYAAVTQATAVSHQSLPANEHVV